MLPILVLMWKCYLVRKRQFVFTVLELVFPLIPILCFSISASKLGFNSAPPTDPDSYPVAAAPLRVSYWPDSSLTYELMLEASQRLGLGSLDHVPEEGEEGYALLSSKYTMAEYAWRMEVGDAIVIFQGLNGTKWPRTLNYTIRMKTGQKPQNIVKLVTQNQEPTGRFDTIFEPFVRLQWAIDTSFLQLVAGSLINPTLLLEAVDTSTTKVAGDGLNYQPLASRNRFAPMISFMIRLCCKLALFLPFVTFITRMLEEKNSGIQELMKMMGVSVPTLYVVHFINVLPVAVVFTIGVPVIIKVSEPPLLPKTSIIIPFLGLTMLFWSIIAFAAFLSYVINSKWPTIYAVMMYSTILFVLPLVAEKITQYTGSFLTGMFPFEPSDWLWQDVGVFELEGQSASLTTPLEEITDSKVARNPSIGICLLYMALQIIVYAALGLFLAYVWPGPYGEGRPYSRPSSKKNWDESLIELSEEKTPPGWKDPQFFETPPKLPVGIELINVTKVFPKHVALKHVTLNVFKGEITLLLGHNGAGKTTLINIISGMCAPTTGQVRINGIDVRAGSHHVRPELGLCPQHNLFFPNLTVQEHIVVFAKLKGVDKTKAYASAAQIVETLGLRSKENSIPNTLSGGMKRRVQLACALAGDSSVLILDEPTSGLDLETRRGLWDLLLPFGPPPLPGSSVCSVQSLRGERTVVLTTHFMEEADALGDRVAALHCGRLKCHATPMFLKKAVGEGYYLSFTTADKPNEGAITELIQKRIPDASVRDRSHKSITYILPSKDSSKFPGMFAQLQDQKNSLGITSIGIGKSSLDEVFQRICSDTPETLQENLQWRAEPTFQKLYGVALYMRQYRVLMHRQFRFLMTGIIQYVIVQIIIPLWIIIAVAFMTNYDVHTATDPHTMKGDKKMFAIFPEGDTPLPNIGYKYVDAKKKTDMTVDLFHGLFKDDFKMRVSYNSTHAKVVYGESTRHAAPVAVNLLSNSLAQYWLGPAGPDITVVNQPLDADYEIYANGQHPPLKHEVTLILCSCFITMVFASAALAPITLAVIERITSTRHIHQMCGCPLPLYWTATLTFHLLAATLFVLVPHVFAHLIVDEHNVLNQLGYLMSSSVIGFLCLLSYSALLLTLSTTCSQGVVLFVNIVSMVCFAFITPMLSWVSLLCGSGCNTEGEILGIVSLLMPLHATAMGLYKCGTTANLNALCYEHRKQCPSLNLQDDYFDNERCCAIFFNYTYTWLATMGVYEEYFRLDDSGAGKELLFLLTQSCFYVWLLLMVDSGVFSNLGEKWTRFNRNNQSRFYDDFVVAERMYVAKAITQPKRSVEDALLCYDVYKQFRAWCHRFMAVKGLNFSVKKGECFGLLGVNGAGKSTAFRMLTAETCPTHGHLLSNGYFINEKYHYMQTFSYCPQFFGLDDFLTGEQNMILVLTLRGLSTIDAREQAASWLKEIGLQKYANRCVSTYSGGCTRRLAAVAALCQRSHVALLDEPTTGVDTAARRRVHAAVLRAKRTKSVVIASHSMDEIEALCDRICIMSAGEAAALGSAAELRARHATGFSAVFKLSAPTAVKAPDGPSAPPDLTLTKKTKTVMWAEQPPPLEHSVNRFREKMHATFDCQVMEDHGVSTGVDSVVATKIIHFHINNLMPYSELFGKIEGLKLDFPGLIEDYLVSDTTLEEVFIAIAKEGPNHAERQKKERSLT